MSGDPVLERLEALELKLKEKRKQSPLSSLLEKAVIPAALGVLAFVGNSASNNIHAGQLRLATTHEQNEGDRAQAAQQLRYMELFYENLMAGDSLKLRGALALLPLIEAEPRRVLAGILQEDPNEEVRTVASSIFTDLQASLALSAYKIGIYFVDDTRDRAVARSIRVALEGSGFGGEIQDYPVDEDFYTQVVPPRELEIRYEPNAEATAFAELSALLSQHYDGQEFSGRPVRSRTPNFISIFVPR